MKDLYSIHEFSKLSCVDATTLRYWDEIGVFSPIKRNPENNYRNYSLVQLLALNFVSTLSDLGIPLKTIAKLREERNSEDLLKVLDRRERELHMELRTIRLRSSIIHARQQLIQYGLKVDEKQVSVEQIEEMDLVLWPRNEYKEGDTFIEPLAAFVNKAADYHINLGFPVGGYWDSFESYANAPDRPDHFISLDPVGTHKVKEGDYLVGFARGYYGDMGDLPERMASYAKENSVNVYGPVYTLYLQEEISTDDPSQYLGQSFIAVSKQRLK